MQEKIPRLKRPLVKISIPTNSQPVRFKKKLKSQSHMMKTLNCKFRAKMLFKFEKDFCGFLIFCRDENKKEETKEAIK